MEFDYKKTFIPKKPTSYRCPICGGAVSELPTFFGCENFRSQDGGCKYKIFKTLYNMPLSEKMMDELLTNGETTEKFDGLRDKKTERLFKARLRYDPKNNMLLFIDAEESDYKEDCPVFAEHESEEDVVSRKQYDRLMAQYQQILQKQSKGEN